MNEAQNIIFNLSLEVNRIITQFQIELQKAFADAIQKAANAKSAN